MTRRESDALVMYLHAGRADWLDKVTEPQLQVWFDGLKLFQAALAHEAVRTFFAARDAKRHGFPPELGEVMFFLDGWIAAREERLAEERKAKEYDVAKRLLVGPVEDWESAKTLSAKGKALVRALMDGEITPGSVEHREKQTEIETLSGRGVSPCCDKDGVTSYEVKRYGNRYTYAARCGCPRGQQCRYAGYPLLPQVVAAG